MPVRAYYLSPEGELRRGLTQEEIHSAFASNQGLLWVDIGETTEEDGQFLERAFGFHHLAVEDCVSPQVHPPKIDDFGSHLFIIVNGINHTAESDIVETTEMAIFLGPHFVVSNHNFPMYSVEVVRRLVEEDGRPMRRGADFLAHALIDTLIDHILPTIDSMGEEADRVEEEAIGSPQQLTLTAVLRLKRSALRLHRVMAPQREVLNRLSRGEFPLIKHEAQIFYRDIYDHIARTEELNQSLRDRADHALTAYLSAVTIRQNETMKVMTVVASIFLSITVVTGIYGMNFENMPELKWRWGYFAVLGVMGAISASALALFWALRWLPRARRIARLKPFAVAPDKPVAHLGHRQQQPRI